MMKPRQCIVLIGERSWCAYSSQQLLQPFSTDQTCCISSDSSVFQHQLDPKAAKSILGQEFDAVVFDVLDSINADSLGICLGTLRAGGLLVLWLPDNRQSTLWLDRFSRIVDDYQQKYDTFKQVNQGETLPEVSVDKENTQTYQTSEQQQAIKAIKHVVYGHRKRPLVLSADRGRGKSAALGIAAAELLSEGKKTILITAPSFATAAVCFEQAHRHLADSVYSKGKVSFAHGEIKFIAPDELIATKPEAELLLVDEAAAIPVAMLSQFTENYSRLVFASTIHGYEGTGRGFAIRFQSVLDQKMPDWRSLSINTPIRWLENDPLERFCFDALLLNASPAKEEDIVGASLDSCSIEKVDRQTLIQDEESLRELFGLMVLAHYRTRPSDLQMMLDREDISLYIVRFNQHIIATAWLVDEGQLDDALAENIYLGKRRLKGQLLPQSLLNHAGIKAAGGLRYRRLMRIAVHPALLRQGFARGLLDQLRQDAGADKIDILGASFSASSDLLKFWKKTGFKLSHIGVQQDHVSSAYTVIMLQGLSAEGEEIVGVCRRNLTIQWPEHLLTRYQQLVPEQALILSQFVTSPNIELDEREMADVTSFVFGQRGYDFCEFAIRRYVFRQLSNPYFVSLSSFHQQLLTMTVLQNRVWSDVASNLGLTGKAVVERELKTALQHLLTS